VSNDQRPDTDDGLTVPSVPQSVAAVRRYAVDACLAHGYDGDCDTLALLVSEVATNARIHGAGQVHVRVLAHGPRLRVEVTDDSDRMPLVRAFDQDSEGGRGLALVDALAAAWGADPRPGGKTVWFELAA
jgi:anti-sigma regulatory factor (Ser/Thr protein kinase)